MVPRARGGRDDPGNLVASCEPCNRAKGATDVRAHRSGTELQGTVHLGDLVGLIVMMGTPGSGKTTLANATWPGLVVSVDAYRTDPDARDHGPAFGLAFSAVRASMSQTIVLDSTATTGRVRSQALSIARETGRLAHLVIVDTPLDVCLERNGERERPVPGEVLHAIRRSFVMAVDVVRSEPWATVTTIGGWSENLYGRRLLDTPLSGFLPPLQKSNEPAAPAQTSRTW